MIIFVKDMKNYFLAFIAGLLLSLSWPVNGFVYFIFIAFVPLFFLAKNLQKKRNKSIIKFLGFSFLTFLLFNVFTTYWVYYASEFGAISAVIVNSFFMSLVMLLFFWAKRVLGVRIGYFSLITFWLTFEYIHLNWDLSWPWLTLGNCFSESLFLINWYEYTGVLGGSLWILLVNILVFELIDRREKVKPFFLLISLLLLPIFLSNSISNRADHIKDYINVVVVQPNIDPYNEKFKISYQQQLLDFINLAKTKIDSTTDLLVGPETALQENIWESKVQYTKSIQELQKLQLDFPELNILVGATTFKLFESNNLKSSTARKFRNEDLWYDVYNSAVFISKSGEVSIYHKTKLVPGAEKIPFPSLLNNFSSLSVDLGGVSGSLGSENSIVSFNSNEAKILPLICYESIYGDLNTGKSFDVMCIITNDGWWKNTVGYKQHFSYAKLRAIEQRRSIIRSANTGISGFINSSGEFEELAKWDEKKVIKSQVAISNTVTFYNQFGDYLGRISSFISSIFLLLMFVKSKVK